MPASKLNTAFSRISRKPQPDCSLNIGIKDPIIKKILFLSGRGHITLYSPNPNLLNFSTVITEIVVSAE